MTATDPIHRCTPSDLFATLPEGSSVRIRNNTGIYTIGSPAAWSDETHSTPTHYNLTGPSGQFHRMVPAEGMTPMSTALREPLITPMRRMLNNPEATRRMGKHYLGAAAATAELRILAKILAPKYRTNHCWCCWDSLNNLDDPLCPKCSGIQCKCGACFCPRAAVKSAPTAH